MKTTLAKFLIIGVFSLLLVIVFFLGFANFINNVEVQSNKSKEETSVEIIVVDCKRNETEISLEIENSRVCSNHSECELTYLPCPFGCYKPINKLKIPKIKQMISNTPKYCESCMYKCASIENVTAICQEGQCTRIYKSDI